MNKILRFRVWRFGLWVMLTIACVLLPLYPVTSQPPPSQSVPDFSLSALQFNPERFQATLDQGNVADAVQQLEIGWKQQFDQYYQQRLRSTLLTPDQIAQSLSRIQTLTGRRSALIYAIAIREQLEVILLLPNGELVHHRVKLESPEALANTFRSFRAGLVNTISPEPQYLPAAQQLYQWIIEPLNPALEQQKINHLIFCLGGGLRSLPMAALHNGRQFLVEQYGVSVIPAFNLLDQNPARLRGLRVLAMGASEFQNQLPLPAVPVELSAIAQIWQGEVFLNDRFTVDQLRQQRDSYPFGIVHLATHAAFTPGAVQNSFIQFWDQPLALDQLSKLDLRQPIVQLLVLSACRTAMGDLNAELGFAGLAVQSGAKAALATLWSISDAATVVVMSNFYQNLKTAPTKTEALRQTQVAMLSKKLSLNSPSIQRTLREVQLPETVTDLVDVDLSHPYYWAGFTMIGNPW
ncbi:CHAT domain-containing protein [Leptolyngbya ohadii]|uniref:CHAT domain-containing protein n=1 Tax=Leptolyngbya ohadii TaxID=1962290 RepID=UPI0019D44436|nr:CHAT domain-containing protein [Leptolyngbya ohadii]